MSIPVKWIMSTMQGAPRLSGTPGDMIALLDACLINGFNVTAPNSLVVASGVASLYYSGGGHGYVQHQVIAVDGSTPATLNGEWRVTEVDANYVRFAVPGEPDGAASGTIGVRAAPLGWEKVFSGTNKAVYRSTDVAGTRLFLRVDDATDKYAYVRGYEDMSDVDTGTGLFPTAAQSAFGITWPKSNLASTAERPWSLLGDTRIIYLFAAWSATHYTAFDGWAFGDIASITPSDTYGAILQGSAAQSPTLPATQFANLSSSTGKYIARAYTQLGSAIQLQASGSGITTYLGANACAYPAPADNGLHLHEPVLIIDGTVLTGPVRGTYPGLAQCIQNIPESHGYILQYDSDILLLVAPAFGTQQGRCAFHLTRAWR